MKQTLAAVVLCLMLFLSFCPVRAPAQETRADGTAQTETRAAADGQKQTGGGQGLIIGGHTLRWWLNRAIDLVSQIGGIFGKATGLRIGGTSAVAIAALVVAKLVQDKAPSWIKWLLYLSGGTMAAGGGANIIQLVMRHFAG